MGAPAVVCLVSPESLGSQPLNAPSRLCSQPPMCALRCSPEPTRSLGFPPLGALPPRLQTLAALYLSVTSVWAPPLCPMVCKVLPDQKPAIMRLVVVQLLSRVRLFATPWTTAHQTVKLYTPLSPRACLNSYPSSR